MPSREYLAWRATFTATYDRANDGRVHKAGGFPEFVTRDLWILNGGAYEDVEDLYAPSTQTMGTSLSHTTQH